MPLRGDPVLRRLPPIRSPSSLSPPTLMQLSKRLFTSLKVSVSSRTVVKWQLTNSAGRVVSAGAADTGEDMRLVKLAVE